MTSSDIQNPQVKGPVLGVDFGLNRTGLAVTDENARLAVGIKTIVGKTGRTLARAVADEARLRKIETIVIGKPSGGRDVDLVINGADNLAETLDRQGFRVVRWDEAFTTSAVLSDRKRIGGKATSGKNWIDEAAAILILNSYIDNMNSGS